MKTRSYIQLFFASLFMLTCETTTNLDLQEDPDRLSVEDSRVDLILNEVQFLFIEFLEDVDFQVDDIVRYRAMSGNYKDASPSGAMNNEWEEFYTLRENQKLLEFVAEDNPDFIFHRAMARILAGHATTHLVDLIGDIPYSEANDFDNNQNPSVDDAQTIYLKVIDDYDLSITELSTRDLNGNLPMAPENDIYYEGNHNRWIRLAQTLKLRLRLQMRLIDEEGARSALQAVIDQDIDLIQSDADNFVVRFSTEPVSPDSRHPYYGSHYGSDGPSGYIGNYFMWLLKDSKPITDPRIRYYLYRQANSDVPSNFLDSCDGIFDWCYLGDFYYGRDHGNEAPSPNDDAFRVVYGLYPGGGAFDNNSAQTAFEAETSLEGAGIMPVMMSFFVDFMMAEAHLMLLGDSATARNYLLAAVQNSIEYVVNFSGIADGSFVPSSSDISGYIQEVRQQYDMASDDSQRLDIIIHEYYLAAFGNSMEAYNFYRRTGYPSTIQVPVMDRSIPFVRSYLYPEDAVNRNTSITQKTGEGITTPVFWDNNPPNFLK